MGNSFEYALGKINHDILLLVVLLSRHGLSTDYSDSMVLIVGERCYRYSSAEILRRLGPPWMFLWPLVLVPPPFRDLVYDFVASRRYRWFGQLAVCRVPTVEERARFVG